VIFGKEGGLCQGTQVEALLPREACTGFRREPGKVASNGYNAAQAVWRPIQPGIPVESRYPAGSAAIAANLQGS
jgi:hypothetical protein